MLKQILVLLLFLSLLLLTFCSDDGIVSPYLSNGTYFYSAYDSSSNKVAAGSLLISFLDSVNFSGNWVITSTSDQQNIGPQKGSGVLLGNIEGGLLYINLNPNYADNNVVLRGEANNNKMVGTWQWVTFSGVTNSGFFEAKSSNWTK
jgi:hypothetical protein